MFIIPTNKSVKHQTVDAPRTVLRGGKSRAEVRAKLGNLRLQQGNVPAAVDLYKQAIQIEPFFSADYLNLARAYLLSDDRENAREILGRLLKIDPGNDPARQAWLNLTPPPATHEK